MDPDRNQSFLCRECGALGRITKTHRFSLDTSDLYCQCTDAECGCSWVAQVSYSHQLSPSGRTTTQLALSLINSLSPDGRQRLQRELNLG
ncbi:ogr/Delta-like zinc finger family protein [Aeromonas hydrophila]|uniref:ogr/Delta-like zinc finger family protein n=1 Tax=Aeromonas hydrophila TaxID=644 RepID=UPI0009B923F0|nr:ogr/Delta-like zinc finger family protein [Aeromonas hydrophila]